MREYLAKMRTDWDQRARETLQRDLETVIKNLGAPGAARRAAEATIEELGGG